MFEQGYIRNSDHSLKSFGVKFILISFTNKPISASGKQQNIYRNVSVIMYDPSQLSKFLI